MARRKDNNLCLNEIDDKFPALVGGKIPVDATVTVDTLTVSQVKLLGVDNASIAPISATTGVYADVRASALPTGAATAAKQPALGTAGTASTDVITVQGIASGTAQPVSAASLPLPSGASTLAKQPALGTAGTASSDVITIQGIASMTKLLVTPDLPTGAATAAKQPALGTAGSASSDVITIQGKASMTAVVIDGSGVTQPVSGTVTTIPTANTRTLAGGAAATSNGSVSSGAFAATFIFSSDFTGTIASTSFNGATDRSFTTPPLPAGQTYGAIAYVVSTGSVRILTIT